MVTLMVDQADQSTIMTAISQGWFEEGKHHYPLLAQFEDTDAGGIVYHANYISYAERGRTAMLRALDVEMNDLVIADQGIVITSLSIDYKKPSFMGDRLMVTTIPVHLGASKLKLKQLVTGIDGELRASLDVTGAFISQNRPIRVPEMVREKLNTQMMNGNQNLGE